MSSADLLTDALFALREEHPRLDTYEAAIQLEDALRKVRRAIRPAPRPKQKISASLRWDVFKRDDFRCRNCGTRDDLSCDHIFPESRGGETTLDNLQTLCRSCNSRKGASTEAGT